MLHTNFVTHDFVLVSQSSDSSGAVATVNKSSSSSSSGAISGAGKMNGFVPLASQSQKGASCSNSLSGAGNNNGVSGTSGSAAGGGSAPKGVPPICPVNVAAASSGGPRLSYAQVAQHHREKSEMEKQLQTTSSTTTTTTTAAAGGGTAVAATTATAAAAPVTTSSPSSAAATSHSGSVSNSATTTNNTPSVSTSKTHGSSTATSSTNVSSFSDNDKKDVNSGHPVAKQSEFNSAVFLIFLGLLFVLMTFQCSQTTAVVLVMVRVRGLEKEAVRVKRQTNEIATKIIRQEKAQGEKGEANTDQNLFNHLSVRRTKIW